MTNGTGRSNLNGRIYPTVKSGMFGSSANFAACIPHSHPADLTLTFPWVGSTASIGHFWAAADAAGRSLTCPLPAQRVHRGSRGEGAAEGHRSATR